MLPEGADKSMVEAISSQMNAAAAELGMAIVGGHAESTPNLTHPIVVGCALGYTPKGKYLTSAGAKAGDKLILTKTAGTEGTAILASDRENELKGILTATELQSAKDFYRRISVVKDALTAVATGGVHAMHDPTEGGVAGGVHEMADAADLGVHVWQEKIAVAEETEKICCYFQIDPILLMGSGALLIAAEPDKAEEIIRSLQEKNIHAAVIGNFLDEKSKRLITMRNGKTEVLSRPASDHLWQALRR
jgi:hydrogenase expression/formation protein HypE